MALIECPDCHTSVSDAASKCPQCGRPAGNGFSSISTVANSKVFQTAIWLVVTPVFIFIALFIYFAVKGNSAADLEKQNLRAAIAQCWEDQARKSLTPGAARLQAGACELLATRYVAAYGRKP